MHSMHNMQSETSMAVQAVAEAALENVRQLANDTLKAAIAVTSGGRGLDGATLRRAVEDVETLNAEARRALELLRTLVILEENA